MASVEKFHSAGMARVLGHNSRENNNPSNPDIDPSRRDENYDLTPDHGGLSPYQYFRDRLDELYIYDPRRTDINVAFGWIVTLPREITSPEDERRFFETVSDFLLERYRPENAVEITVHRDEGGQPHLHYIGIPAVPNNLRSPEHPQEEKLSCKEVINRRELRAFHGDLQKYLDEHDVSAQVYTGVTGGKNRTVEQLKRESISDLLAELDRLRDVERHYNDLVERTPSRWERGHSIDRERSRNQ